MGLLSLLMATIQLSFAAPSPKHAWLRDWVQSRTAAPGSGDQAKDLLDEVKFSTLESMRSAGLEQATASVKPWSDSYWPIYQGVIANRYADPEFPASMNWKANNDYLQARIGAGATQILSPAEKYDLLVGDPKFTLTRKMLDQGRYYYEKNGGVEIWMGLCHGWAPASFMVERPRRSVTMLAADGQTRIEFLPADIRALTTLLWADGNFETRFVGSRCNTEDPESDENERPKDSDCLDSNPATWHLVAVNQIGHFGRSLVMDAAYDYEVWNHPVTSYRYTYFQPTTGQPAPTLEAARVRVKDYSNDPYAKTRAPSAVHIVGVQMEVVYALENSPSTATASSEADDYADSTVFRYDLELDSAGRIVGGEWRTRTHPDFLWVPAPGAKAQSIGDRYLPPDSIVWNGDQKIPPAWRKAALQSASYGQPLARIVNTLVRLSK